MKTNYLFPIFFLAALFTVTPLFASSDSVEIWVPLGSFIMVVLIVASISFSRAYIRGKQYEVFQKYVEAGKEIPADLLMSPKDKVNFRGQKESYLLSGLVNLAVGLGLGLMFWNADFGDEKLWGIGFIPGFIGVAYMIMYAVAASKDKNKE